MKNKDIEKIVGSAFEKANPDLFNKILERIPNYEESSIKISFWKKVTQLLSSKKFAYSFSSFVLILSISLIWVTQPNSTNETVFSVIAIDVNPSLVLELNDEDKVINVIKNNADAVIIVGNMDLIDVDYNVAVNALIGSMVSNGYIDEFKNSVLLSIKSDDLIHEELLMSEVTLSVYNFLNSSSINGSIITQEFSEDDVIKILAERLNISEAKAELIFEITELDPRVTVEELALLSINDLNLYLESKNYSINDIDKVGTASNLGNITEESAYQLALSELSLDEVNVVEYEIELEQENGVLVYEIQINTATEDFEVLVNAKNGTIEIDYDDDDDDEFPTEAMSESELLNTVLLELGINEIEISELEIEQEHEGGIAFYEIKFEYQNKEYKLDVDAITGEILTNSLDETGYDYMDDEEDEEAD